MMRRLAIPIVVLVTLLPALDIAAAAQGQSNRGAGPRAPVRIDPLTASIRGQITTADSGAAVRRAEVRVMSDRGISRLATTDADGRFEVRDLPAGDYRLTVTKRGFVPAQFGQRRPFAAADAVKLAEGARVTANVALTRGAAITGRISDEFGDPAEGVLIQVMRSRTLQGQRRLVGIGMNDRTDDTGAFRVYGLPPGNYYVAATARPGPSGANRSVPTYFPGTVSLADAQRVTLGIGTDAIADFQLLSSGRGARVSGVVVDAAGAPASAAMVNLTSLVVGLGPATRDAGVAPLSLGGHAEADGSFSIPNVPPGQYMLNAMKLAGGPGDLEMARMPLVVDNADITGLTLTSRPPAVLNGTIVRDAAASRALPLGVTVEATELRPGGMSMHQSTRNGFKVTVSGPFRLQVQGLPDDWMVKSIMIDGAEVSDGPIDLRTTSAVARVVLTDRVTEVHGIVGNDDRARGGTVIVFPDDDTKWTYPSRYVRASKPDDQGAFRITGLPPDERYLAVALDFVEDGEAEDPEFLERLKTRATSFSLGDAERKVLNLPLSQR